MIVRSAAWRSSRSRTLPTAEPAALQLATVSQELRAFDAVSRVKRFDTSQEMRFAAWAESGDTGIALVHTDQAKLLVAGEEGQFASLSGPGATSAVRVGSEPPEPWDDRPFASGSAPPPA